MNRTYHFISGLPRSGSTLLSSILKQNPRFTSGISDPIALYCDGIIRDTHVGAGMGSTVSIEKRKEIIRGIFDSFYSDSSEVCFNTNRGWASNTALLSELYPNFKMIVCVRDIPWILDSFEQLNNKNPFTVKPLYNHQQLPSVYERTHMLMGNFNNNPGFVACPLDNVKQSMHSTERNQICYVEYDTLVKSPESTMKQIYEFLGEQWFEHDYNNVEDSYDEFDDQANLIGLHSIRKKVEYRERNTVIPPDLWKHYEQASFWKYDPSIKRELNWVSNNILSNKVSNKINKQL